MEIKKMANKETFEWIYLADKLTTDIMILVITYRSKSVWHLFTFSFHQILAVECTDHPAWY